MKRMGYDVSDMDLSLLQTSEEIKCCKYLPMLVRGVIGNYKQKDIINNEKIYNYLSSIYGPKIWVPIGLKAFDGFSKKIKISDLSMYSGDYETIYRLTLLPELPTHPGSYIQIKENTVVSCFFKKISHVQLLEADSKTASDFLTQNADQFDIPLYKKQEYSEREKLKFIWENKKRYLLFQTFLYFSFSFSILSTLTELNLYYFLLLLFFWLLCIPGIIVDKLFYNSLGNLKNDGCMHYYLQLKQILKKDLAGYCWLTVSSINGIPHIEYKGEHNVNSMDIVLGRYSLNYNDNMTDPLIVNKEISYNNFGYTFWFFNRDNFKIGFDQKNYLCNTRLNDVEFDLLNFQYWIKYEEKRIFDLAFENMTGLRIGKLSIHQNNKYKHLFAMFRISKGRVPITQMNKRFNNIYPKLVEEMKAIKKTILETERIKIQVPVIEETVDVVESEIKTYTTEYEEKIILIDPKYSMEDIATSHYMRPSFKRTITEKYLPKDEVERHHTKVFKEMISLCNRFDNIDKDWRDHEVVKKEMKIEKMVSEPKQVEHIEVVRKTYIRKKYKTKEQKENDNTTPEKILITKTINVGDFKKMVTPEAGRLYVSDPILDYELYSPEDSLIRSVRGFLKRYSKRIKRLMREDASLLTIHGEMVKRDNVLADFKKFMHKKYKDSNLVIKNEYIENEIEKLKLEHFLRTYFFKYDIDKFTRNLANNFIANSTLKGTSVFRPNNVDFIKRKDMLFKFID